MDVIGGVCRRMVVAGLLLFTADGARADLIADLKACAEIEQDHARLLCFDSLANRSSALSFDGFGNGSTDVFEITAPATLEYVSDDAVLVIYLQADSGQLVQNLHLGGQGKAYYRIEEPGRYQLQIDATGGWRIRIISGASQM